MSCVPVVDKNSAVLPISKSKVTLNFGLREKMAANELNRDDKKIEEFDDFNAWFNGSDVYTDPKTLKRLHTLYMKYIQETRLKSDKGSGDENPCPICTDQHKIPQEGFNRLSMHIFIVKLVQMANVSDQWVSSRALCDACLEDNRVDTGKEIPVADTYCVDCSQKFCENCCGQHGKFKVMKNHELFKINQDNGDQQKMIDLAPNTSICEVHEQKVLDVYCADCKRVLCAICFIEDHNNHKGSHVNKCVDDFRKQMQNNIKATNECIFQVQTKKAEIMKTKKEMQRRVESFESVIEKRKDEIKRLTDKHAHCLLQGLRSKVQDKLKEIQVKIAEINTYLSCLGSYNLCCKSILVNGSSSDICRAVFDLTESVLELLQQECQPSNEREIMNFKLCFRKSELEHYMENDYGNLVGEIEDECDLKARKRKKRSQFAELNKEIDRLRKEIKIERTEKESLLLATEQLKINLNKGVEALRVHLIKKEANHHTEIEKLRKALDNNRIAIKALQAKNEELKLKFHAVTATNNSLQTNNYEPEDVMPLETSTEKLVKELRTTETARHRYELNPVLVQTIRIKATEEKNKSISGLTILDNELFVTSEESSEIEVYDSIQLSFSRRWKLKKLIYPVDIVSCNRNKCLYIFDYKSPDQSMKILRVGPNGNLIIKWSTGDACGWGLSVTDESNIILIVYKQNKLNEYSPDGQLIREISLSLDSGIHHPLHAIKLTNGHFVVSHGDDYLHRVCVVDGAGKLMKSCGGERGSTIGLLNEPVYLSVDGNGFLMVADFNNSRVLLLDSDLKFKKEILSVTDGHELRHPERIFLDESNGRLFVADNESNNEGIQVYNLD